jgi:hypothetical protein
MLAGVFMAGFGVCKGIVEGRRFIDLIPFYIISLFGIYLYLSVMSMVDMPSKRNALKTNLIDYLENTVARRLEQGMVQKEKLDEPAKSEVNNNTKEDTGFSPEEVLELEEFIKTIIGN